MVPGEPASADVKLQFLTMAEQNQLSHIVKTSEIGVLIETAILWNQGKYVEPKPSAVQRQFGLELQYSPPRFERVVGRPTGQGVATAVSEFRQHCHVDRPWHARGIACRRDLVEHQFLAAVLESRRSLSRDNQKPPVVPLIS